MATKRGLQWYDYLIFGLILLVSLSIGVYTAIKGRGKSVRNYLTGNRKLRTVPVGLSMFMSYVSAVLLLGNTAETYHYGPMQWMNAVGNSLANIFTVVFLVPLFYPLKVTSAFQYLELRYKSKAVRRTGSFLLVISALIYMGIAMYAPATALDAVTGFPTWASIVITGVVATIYTSIGGLTAVVWTDAFQAIVYLLGIVVILIMGSIRFNGFGEIWDINMENGRIDTWDFTFSPLVRMSFWSVTVGNFVGSIGTHGVGQTAVQRYCSLPTMKASKWSLILCIPLFFLIYSMTTLVGFVVFAFYHDEGCDPLRSGQISNSNQLLPYFIVEGLQIPGLSGLFVAILFSGCLSTLSSSLTSIAAVTWKDAFEWKFHDLPETTKAFINKIIAAVMGFASIGMAFLAQILGGHVLQAVQGVAGSVSGPTVGMFLLGMFFPCANWIGALVGAWTALAFSLTVTIGNYVEQPFREVLNTTIENCAALGYNDTSPMPTNPPGVNPLFKMSFMWYSPLGAFTCVVVGLLVSLFTKRIAGPQSLGDNDPRLIIPVFDRVLWCLPSSWLQKLRCGIPFDEVKEAPDVRDNEQVEMDQVQDNIGFHEEKPRENNSEEKSLRKRSDLPPSYSFVYDNNTFYEENDIAKDIKM